MPTSNIFVPGPMQEVVGPSTFPAIYDGAERPFLPQSLALFNAMAVPPSDERKAFINEMFYFLMDHDQYDKLDGLCIVDHAANVQNWIHPNLACTKVGTPDVIADRGTKGNGTNQWGYSLGINPNSFGGKFSTNSSTLFAYILTDLGVGGGADCGSGVSTRIFSRTSGALTVRPNSSSNATFTVPNSVGMFGWQRKSATHVQLFHNQDASALLENASTGTSNSAMKMGYADGNAGARRVLLVGWGNGDIDMAAINEFCARYAAGVGAEFEANLILNEPSGSPAAVPYRVFDTGRVALTGSVIGTGLDVEAKITEAADASQIVKDWTVFASDQTTEPFAEDVPDVPFGTYYKAEIRFTDLSFATGRTLCDFGVGHVALFIGASNMEREWRIFGTPPADAGGDIRRFTGAATTGVLNYGGWPLNSSAKQVGERGGPYGGQATVHRGNLLEAAVPGISWGLVQLAIGGSTLADWLASNFMNYSVSDPRVRGCPTWSQIGAVFWREGGASAAEGVTKEQYREGIDTLLASIRGYTGTDTPFCIAIPGKTLISGSTDENVNGVRQAQLEFLDETTELYCEGNHVVLPVVDSTGHYTDAGRDVAAAWGVRAHLYILGYVPNGADGPKPSTATATGNTISATVTHSGGSTLVDLSGSASGTGLGVSK